MQRSNAFRRLGRTGTAGLLTAVLAASAAEAALPTGGMLLPRPRGPARADLPTPTAISVYRIPTATAYGIFVGSSPSQASEDLFSSEAANEETASVAANRLVIRPRVAMAPNPFEAFESTPQTSAANESAGDSVVEPLPDAWATEDVSAGPSDTMFAGLRGICPVTLREERRVVTPQPGLVSEYEGRRYEFATPEAKAAFDADPGKYAPAFGGRDVVLTSAGATEAVGSLKHAGFYRERLYLFQTEDTCKAFHDAPRRFAIEE